MTDDQISKALALAIGYTESRIGKDGMPDPDVIVFEPNTQYARVAVWISLDEGWRTFDYRDPTVIWPIAERYNAFPFMEDFGTLKGKWVAQPGFNDRFERVADTAAKAVALAVIAGAKK